MKAEISAEELKKTEINEKGIDESKLILLNKNRQTKRDSYQVIIYKMWIDIKIIELNYLLDLLKLTIRLKNNQYY